MRKKPLLIVLVVAAVVAWAHFTGPHPHAPAPVVTPSVAPVAPTATPTPAPTATDSADPTSDLQALAVAAVTAWQQPTIEGRQAALTAIADPTYVEQAVTIDPTNVPTGTPRDPRLVAAADGTAAVAVTLDDAAVLVTLNNAGRWVVTSIDPWSGQ